VHATIVGFSPEGRFCRPFGARVTGDGLSQGSRPGLLSAAPSGAECRLTVFRRDPTIKSCTRQRPLTRTMETIRDSWWD
ncbi:MAG: hypothetical protein ABIN58_11280, partial [candidate division WOR-3 bacterium]